MKTDASKIIFSDACRATYWTGDCFGLVLLIQNLNVSSNFIMFQDKWRELL